MPRLGCRHLYKPISTGGKQKGTIRAERKAAAAALVAMRAPCGFDGAVTGSRWEATVGRIARGKMVDLNVTRGKAESYDRRYGMNGLSNKVGGEGQRADGVEH